MSRETATLVTSRTTVPPFHGSRIQVGLGSVGQAPRLFYVAVITAETQCRHRGRIGITAVVESRQKWNHGRSGITAEVESRQKWNHD